MRSFAAALAAIAIAGCAATPESKPATTEAAAPATAPAAAPAMAAKDACPPPPKELVTKDLAPGRGTETIRFRTAVLVAYTGWLYDGCAKDHKGQEFDTSSKRLTPLGFLVGAGKVIKGWEEGIKGMKEGGKRQLVIPPDLAYGDRAVGEYIKPNSTLVFEVEILRIIGQADQVQTKPQS